MQANLEVDERDRLAEIAAKVSEDFDFKLMVTSSEDTDANNDVGILEENEDSGLEEEDEDEHEDEDDDDDFSFVFNGSNTSPVSADVAFQDGQIRPFFPLFNRDLLLADEDYKISRLPLRPPVEKVFIETPPSPSTSEKTGEIEGIASGPYCAWSKAPASAEVCKKSNSTGFSKLWRFKEYTHRSHSDGRDAFVFLNDSETAAATRREGKVVQKVTAGKSSSEKKTAGEVKANVAGGNKKVKKGVKTPSLSPHEVYLRNKGHNEEDRRRSYLPYRPELVGFFTNVNGGLSRNVHPF